MKFLDNVRARMKDLGIQYHGILQDEELSSIETVLNQIEESLNDLQGRILKL